MIARRQVALGADACGVVLVEFLIAFVPVFLLFLVIVQLALLAAARLVVQHAAYAGVRAAVVVLDDDPRFYAGTPRSELRGRGDAALDWERRFAAQFGGGGASVDIVAPADGPRLAAIRRAVHARIAAIVPDPSIGARLLAHSRSASVGAAIGSQPLSRLAFGLAWYAGTSTALTFPTAPGGTLLQTETIAPRASVTLRITHLFACLVPIASWLLCSSLSWDARADRLASRGVSAGTRQALAELRLAPRAQDQRWLARAAIPFTILRAEATLPAQNARYTYAVARATDGVP